MELLFPRTKGILVCSVYRPPNDSGFLPKLELSLSRINPGSEFYILGDLNIDLYQGRSPLSSKYREILNFFGCEQLGSPQRLHPLSIILSRIVAIWFLSVAFLTLALVII